MTPLRTLIILTIVAVAGVLIYTRMSPVAPQAKPVATAHYLCDGGKTIDAAFYAGSSTPATAGQPPQPGGSVALTLSDGSTMTLPQTISADGSRYATKNDSFVFWSKGDGAMVQENGQTSNTYQGCVVVAPEPAGSTLSGAYASSTLGFSIRYPQGSTVDTAYLYQEMGPGKAIPGVKFTIPQQMATGTNLGSDSYLSVEQLPNMTTCSAADFLENATARSVTENGTTYSVASTTGAGAGNRYEETVYAKPGTNPCTAVRYFIHYSVFENYPAGTVTRYDHAALIKLFDSMRNTLVLK